MLRPKRIDAKYKLTLSLSRRVRVPQYGPHATTICSIDVEYTYGKEQDFPSSKIGIEQLKEKAKIYESQCSEISIICWRGLTGISQILKKEDIAFDTDFKGKKIQI